MIPSLWTGYISPLFQEYSLTVYLENKTRERYASKFRISIIQTETGRVIDDGETNLGGWIHFGKVQKAGKYTLQGIYSEGISQMVYSTPISISGKDDLKIGFPDQWTPASSDLSSLSKPVATTMSDFPTDGPSWMKIALSEEAKGINEHEAGPATRIQKEYFNATDLGPQNVAVDWAGAFVSFVLREAGYKPVKGSARAENWRSFGEPLSEPKYGALVIFAPSGNASSGHIGFVVGHDAYTVQVLGGNQSDAVNIKRFPLSRVVAFRWPAAKP